MSDTYDHFFGHEFVPPEDAVREIFAAAHGVAHHRFLEYLKKAQRRGDPVALAVEHFSGGEVYAQFVRSYDIHEHETHLELGISAGLHHLFDLGLQKTYERGLASLAINHPALSQLIREAGRHGCTTEQTFVAVMHSLEILGWPGTESAAIASSLGLRVLNQVAALQVTEVDSFQLNNQNPNNWSFEHKKNILLNITLARQVFLLFCSNDGDRLFNVALAPAARQTTSSSRSGRSNVAPEKALDDAFDYFQAIMFPLHKACISRLSEHQYSQCQEQIKYALECLDSAHANPENPLSQLWQHVGHTIASRFISFVVDERPQMEDMFGSILLNYPSISRFLDGTRNIPSAAFAHLTIRAKNHALLFCALFAHVFKKLSHSGARPGSEHLINNRPSSAWIHKVMIDLNEVELDLIYNNHLMRHQSVGQGRTVHDSHFVHIKRRSTSFSPEAELDTHGHALQSSHDQNSHTKYERRSNSPEIKIESPEGVVMPPSLSRRKERLYHKTSSMLQDEWLPSL
ncbi:hypothetical protein OIO90_004313 [Microbotryomycetes sp. JL221]|nr:hypothetical protein OIO90_004313 [Microbotryomycetes sp. JL221]